MKSLIFKLILKKTTDMKRLFFMGVFALCLLQAHAVGRFPQNGVAVFDSLVAASLNKLNGPTSIDIFQKVRGEMARICDVYHDSWIPYYYHAWLGIQTCLLSRNDKDGMMEDCFKQIEKAEKQENADLSELYALKAYYYYVLIATNSKVNGPKYYSHVFRECEKSLEKNSKNPRALAILYVFRRQMASFLQAKTDNGQQELEGIMAIFDIENKNTILPRWGKELLSYVNIR